MRRIILFILVVCLYMVSCKKEDPTDNPISLKGTTWTSAEQTQTEDNITYKVKYILYFPDNENVTLKIQVSYNGISQTAPYDGSYTYDSKTAKGTATITIDGETADFIFTISGNKLMATDDEGFAIEFTAVVSIRPAGYSYAYSAGKTSLKRGALCFFIVASNPTIQRVQQPEDLIVTHHSPSERGIKQNKHEK